MRTIVAPTDFSAVSLNAVNYAADMACAIQASLSLIHVCPLPASVGIAEFPVSAEILQQLIDDAETRIARLKEEIHIKTGGKIKIYTEVGSGNIIDQLHDYCAIVKPYAVVMGPRGAGVLERFLFGSHTIAAIRHLPWPLIIVPPEVKFRAIKKIGLACDLKKVVETSPIEEIKLLVKEFRAELHVLHVNAENDKQYSAETVDQSGMLQEMLNEMHPSYHFLNNMELEKGISEFAEKNELDLLIVVPKKHNLMGRIFHKSHSKDIVLHTHVPIMAIHED